MANELQTVSGDNAAMLEKVVIGGDLGSLSPGERMAYYTSVCESMGLNPLTKPFDYIRLNGKLTLYARRDATDQLRKIHGVSLAIIGRETIGDVYVVTAQASDRDGRSDESTGAVATKGLSGEALANAYMKAETKAKRRVTLSLVGLGWLDENEVVTVASAQSVIIDDETGEIVEHARPTVSRPTPAAPPTRPYDPDTLKAGLLLQVAKRGGDAPCDSAKQGMLAGSLDALFAIGGDDKDTATAKRHSLLKYLTGNESTKALSVGWINALTYWCRTQDDDGQWVPTPMAIDEAALVINHGQEELPL